MSVDSGRRQALYAAKLRALVKEHWGDVDGAEPATFPGGAALHAGPTGWVLADESPSRSLGGALAWASRRGVTDLHVLAPADTGLLARRASCFVPAPTVWRIEGTTVAPAEADPVPADPELPPAAAELEPMLVAAGARPVVEGGVLSGEVLGLEVGRVIVDGPIARLEAGVGKHDREANKLANGDEPPVSALARAVDVVRRHRIPGSLHELSALATERWLRAVVIANPSLVGAAHLEAVPSPVPRHDLRIPAPAPAAGTDLGGHPLLVVCSTGIDVDLVPAAADAWLRDGRRPRLVLCLPAADLIPTTRALAAALIEPAEVVTVDQHWRELPVS